MFSTEGGSQRQRDRQRDRKKETQRFRKTERDRDTDRESIAHFSCNLYVEQQHAQGQDSQWFCARMDLKIPMQELPMQLELGMPKTP